MNRTSTPARWALASVAIIAGSAGCAGSFAISDAHADGGRLMPLNAPAA